MLFLLAAALAAPFIPEGAVVYPQFSLKAGARWNPGAGFLVEGPTGQLLVTTLGHFGPAAGLRYQLSGDEVVREAAVVAFDWRTERKVLTSRVAVATAYASASGEDVAASVVTFRVALDGRGRAGGKVPTHPLVVSAECPAEGALVYIPGSSADVAQGINTLGASVEACDDRTLRIRLANATTSLHGLRGAPILDGDGRVVGMLAREAQEPGTAVADAVAGAAILAHIENRPLAPLQPPPPPPCPWGTLDTGWTPIDNPWGYDLPGLHAILLSEWGISGKHDELLVDALFKNRDIGPIFREIHRLSWSDNMGNFARINQMVRRWEAFYDTAGIPLRMNVAASGQVLAFMTWKVEATTEVTLGDKTVAIDLVGRLDKTNVADPVPSLLDDDPGAVVPLEDLRDDQLYPLWTRLDPASKDRLAGPLRDELTSALGASVFDTLIRSAPLRGRLDAVTRAVNARGACSNFGMVTVPWWGVSGEHDTLLSSYVSGGQCPPISARELAELRSVTAELASVAELEPSLAALLAHMARSTSVEAAGMRLACADCSWASRVRPGAIAALADSATRVTAQARLCERARRDKALSDFAAEIHLCDGKKLAELGPLWPADWGPPGVRVATMPGAVPTQWPRDRR